MNLTPKEIVAELNHYIVGQEPAKRSVAVALRNRWRSRQLPPDLQEEVIPKNILMIGPTGVGKTEIARRLAKLVNAPFIKVEATKFTEVGYVGRDVESIVRDLVETAIRLVKNRQMEGVQSRAEELAYGRMVDILKPLGKMESLRNPFEMLFNPSASSSPTPPAEPNLEEDAQLLNSRQELLRALKAGKLDQEMIEITVEDQATPMGGMFSGSGMEELGSNLQDMLGNLLPKKQKKKKVTIATAKKILMQEEAQKLIDMDQVISEAVFQAENHGIVFLDEIDKVASRGQGGGPDVSREGVQRDILPIVEGSTVMTKYGPVKTDHVLFIAAGAFHVSKPSDLIPELQGRFPIRVELSSLSKEDFKQILTEPDNALIKQYVSLLGTEGVSISFTGDAIDQLADLAQQVNEQTENIGARRLHTLLEKLLEDLAFDAPDMAEKELEIDREYVKSKLSHIVTNQDLSHFIL